jgi:hypothetical protein
VIYVGLKGLDTAVGHPIQLLLDKITEKVTHWYQERRVNTGNKRPLSLTFRDEEGQPLRAVEMHPKEDVAKKPNGKKPSKSRPRRLKKPPTTRGGGGGTRGGR